MSTNTRPLPVAVSFLSYLQRYREDRAALADLRGALSHARRPRAWPLLARFEPAIGNRAYETVAALWAIADRRESEAGCLADTCRGLAGAYDARSGKYEHDSFQARFRRLLTCDLDGIAAYVAPVVRAAQAKGMEINYQQLLSDLLCWGDDVKVRWARAFWGAFESDAENQTTPVETSEAQP